MSLDVQERGVKMKLSDNEKFCSDMLDVLGCHGIYKYEKVFDDLLELIKKYEEKYNLKYEVGD